LEKKNSLNENTNVLLLKIIGIISHDFECFCTHSLALATLPPSFPALHGLASHIVGVFRNPTLAFMRTLPILHITVPPVRIAITSSTMYAPNGLHCTLNILKACNFQRSSLIHIYGASKTLFKSLSCKEPVNLSRAHVGNKTGLSPTPHSHYI
jgi:hypothetical protein